MRTYQDFAGIRLSNDPLAKPRVTVGGNSTRATKLTVYHIRDAVEVIYSLCTGPPPPPSHFSRVQLCATPRTAAYQASPSMGFSRQEHWSGLPFPSPMHESGKWKWSHCHAWLLGTPWTAAYQAPPSMGFSRQEYWSGVPLPSPMYRTATAAKSL